ncbi:MAG: beta-lactamase hydrolase domain-containing protein [Aureliella sp.]
MDAMKISDEVTVGPQPTEEQLQDLAGQGFKSVVNFRTEGEEDQPLSPADEEAKAKKLGLEYLHVPVSMKSMSPQCVDQFRQQYPDLPKPVFAHCKSGKRAGAMVMMHLASAQGMSGQQTLQQAEQMGFKCDQPELKQFVEQYVDSHAEGRRS